MEFVDLKLQYQVFRDEILHAVDKVFESGQFILGDEVEKLEEKLAELARTKHAVTTSSGTDSLLIALKALGVGPGDEVITVPFTWISTVSVIHLIGAKPVFVDIDPKTYLIDPNLLEDKITSKTKAIIPVSLFGQMPDFEQINQIAKNYDLHVIEDGAQSFGASQKGKMSCGATHVGATSFFPSKPLGGFGDGGALFTDDLQLKQKMIQLRNHGGDRNFNFSAVGINGRLDTLQAALLLVKLPHFKHEIEKRQKIALRYTQALQEACEVPMIASGNTHVFAQYTIRLKERDKVIEELEKNKIPARVYYPKCIHEQSSFSYLGYHKGSFPISEKATREVLSLPIHPWLDQDEQNKVIEAILSKL